MAIKSYVISLNSAILRREHIVKEFNAKNVEFEFFDAISPSNEMDVVTQNLIPALAENETLTNGEKGCLLSHLALWKKCVDENLGYIAIFEDDVLLSDDISTFINDESWLIKNFNRLKPLVVRFETYKMPVKLSLCEEKQILNRSIRKLESAHWGTAGYVINQKMASFLLQFFSGMSKNNIIAIDKVMFESLLSNKELQIYQFAPALCIQEVRMNEEKSKLLSDIGERQKNKQDKTLFSKLSKEYVRLKRKILHKLNKFETIKFQ